MLDGVKCNFLRHGMIEIIIVIQGYFKFFDWDI